MELPEFQQLIMQIKSSKHISQKQVAKECGYDKGHFNRMFKGAVPLSEDVVFRAQELNKKTPSPRVVGV